MSEWLSIGCQWVINFCLIVLALLHPHMRPSNPYFFFANFVIASSLSLCCILLTLSSLDFCYIVRLPCISSAAVIQCVQKIKTQWSQLPFVSWQNIEKSITLCVFCISIWSVGTPPFGNKMVKAAIKMLWEMALCYNLHRQVSDWQYDGMEMP